MAGTEEVWLPREKFTTTIEALHSEMMANVLEGKSRNRSVPQKGSRKVVFWNLRSSPSSYQPCSTRLSDTWGMAYKYSPDRALAYLTSHTSEQRSGLLRY